MRNKRALIAFFIMLMLLTGCSLQSFDAERNTVYVKKDGTVMQAIIEDFSADYYDSAELEDLINQDVDIYNSGTENVKVESYKVKNETAKLITSYKTAADYAKFNEVEFFVGTISEAKTEGYDFDETFTSTDDNNTISAETIKSFTQYKIIVFEEDVHIQTDSKILYISSNINLVDSKTAARAEEAEGLAYVVYE
ncbi:hypothetical protein [Konateibacter massiliensis]|uniref:hypothetical protein n=1 Tax=Konateibacter massiliensis TaxID=2002841 RepID=UPI000C158093|nr:hypothetical protein [Konateibacter massiliensis]